MPFVNDVFWQKIQKSEEFTNRVVNDLFHNVPDEVSNIIHNYFSSTCDYNFDNDNLWHGKYPVIVDNSITIKAGFSNDDYPRKVFPCVIGRSRGEEADDANSRDVYIGEEVQNKKASLSIRSPIENNAVTNWDDMEKIWYYTFHNKLGIKPKDHAILLTEAPLNFKYNREKMIEIMTEYFNFPSMYLGNQSALALYSNGLTTGLVVDSGDSATFVVAVDEGYAPPKSTKKLYIGGRDVSNYLSELLTKRGHTYTTPQELSAITDIKETMCYVAQDFKKELDKANSSDDNKKTYELPDGDVIATVNYERIQAPEILFQPKMVETFSKKGLHTLCYQAVQESNPDIRKYLYKNLVFSGGNTMFHGLQERLTKELVALSVPEKDINIVAPSQRKNSTWVGGALLSSLSTFQESWITNEDYDEFGPGIVHRKCW